MTALLRLENVTTYYGQMRILEGVSLQVGNGELVCLLGGNASGKSTTLKTILGIVQPRTGAVLLDGEDVSRWPVPQRIAKGIAIVPENRRLFGQLTVRENLELGAVLRGRDKLDDDFDRIHTLFPRLLERRSQLAGTLSGGEQQMVAMGRALMSRPRLLLMDEPSMGLSPALVQQNFKIIKDVHLSGVSVLMVEQNATMALTIADRGYVLSTGEIVLDGAAADLLRSEDLKRAYLRPLAPRHIKANRLTHLAKPLTRSSPCRGGASPRTPPRLHSTDLSHGRGGYGALRSQSCEVPIGLEPGWR